MSGKNEPTDFYIDRLIANRYRVKELIGRGGMGRVYRAEDSLLGGVTVALKFLSQSLLDDRMQRSFAREARICAQLGNNSIHIVRVMDYGINQVEEPYYVMEYLRGDNLKNLISARPLPLPQFLFLTRQLCLGLQSAHKGIEIDGKLYPVVHRDIKPANILICPDPTLVQLVKILDFGIAKFFSDNTCTSQTNSYIGTLAYSSPEQIEGAELDCRSDIYSLGVMMFEMLTGKRPWVMENESFGAWYKAHHFQAPCSFKSVDDSLNIPNTLEDLVISCMAKSPSDRPQTIIEVLKTLEFLQQSINQPLNQERPVNKTIPPNSSTEKTEFFKKQETHNQTKQPTKPQEIKEESLATSTFTLKGMGTSQLPLNVETVCWKAMWPQNKPISEIVFPNFIQADEETLPSLWAMMPKEEIQKHLGSLRYNHFLCLMNPHPVILWITALHHPQYGTRWLPCFLDLKTFQGRKTAHLLAEAKSYPILLFIIEKPNICRNIMNSIISSDQCQLLKEWIVISDSRSSTNQAEVSKRLLKTEYDKVKPTILKKLEAKKADSQPEIENIAKGEYIDNLTSSNYTFTGFKWIG